MLGCSGRRLGTIPNDIRSNTPFFCGGVPVINKARDGVHTAEPM
jgi:hypothetical protein